MTSRRAGFSLVELVVSLTLGGLVLVSLARVIEAQARLAGAQTERVLGAETLRVASIVLAAELRTLAAARDIRVVGRDSIVLRAFRGLAIACGRAGAATLVRYRGARDPDPVKDSVLAFGGADQETPRPLQQSLARPAACAVGPGEEVLAWSLGPPLPAATLLLLFESGSYHLTGAALRYRRGPGGRQPLTAEALGQRSGIHASHAGVLAVDLVLRGDSMPPAGARGGVHLLVALLNAQFGATPPPAAVP